MIDNSTKIGVIGVGQVGYVLSLKLFQKKLLHLIVSKNQEKTEKLIANGINKNQIFKSVSEINSKLDYIIIAVKEDQIQNVVEDLNKINFNLLQKTVIFHTSGTLPKNILNKLCENGAIIGAAHPFQTFFKQDINILNDIAWGIDCDEVNYTYIQDIILALNGKPVLLPKNVIDKKYLYHISAIIASNFTTAIISIAKDLLNDINLEPKIFLEPIIRQTISNTIENLDNDNIPITGPVARADFDTIAKHIQSLRELPNIEIFYKNMSKTILDIIESKQIIKDEDYIRINQLLNK